jgi:hypothetical protein
MYLQVTIFCSYGKRYTAQIFEGKRFFLAKSFVKENEKKPAKYQNCTTLIEQLGKGKIIGKGDEADFTLVGSVDKETHTVHYLYLLL